MIYFLTFVVGIARRRRFNSCCRLTHLLRPASNLRPYVSRLPTRLAHDLVHARGLRFLDHHPRGSCFREPREYCQGESKLARSLPRRKFFYVFQSTNTYQHQSTLRLILAGSGVNSFPGLSAVAPDMTEFFTGP
jgi:hypothetical protein